MTKNTNPLAWIDQNDREQIAWVNRYLWQHLPLGSLVISSTSDMAIYQSNTPLLINADLILLINKMRSAWRQKQFRSKQNGKKTYSFVMSTEVEKKLKVLAGSKGKIRETLEVLITQNLESEVPKIKDLQNKNKELQAKSTKMAQDLLNIKKVNHDLNQACRCKDDELSRLQKEVKQLQQDKANLSNELQQLKEKHNNQFREKSPDIDKPQEQALQTP